MAVTWHKEEKFLGVRYREHATRKHGVKFDRCYSIRYKLNGKDKEEVVGWGSEGVTAEKAFKILSTIRESIRQGAGPQSIAAMRQAGEEKTREDAKARRRKEIEDVTLSDFWEAEYLPAAEATKTARTMKGEKGLYENWIRPALGDLPLRKIDVQKVEALVLKATKAGKSAATVRYIMAVISQVWNKAATRDIVQGNSPTKMIKKPRQDNRRIRFLTEDEATKLLEALSARSIDLHDSALLALYCGMRAGEIHALTWGDIDFANGTIAVLDTKNTIDRHAFLTVEVEDMLKRRRSNQAKTSFVFPATNEQKREWISATFFKVIDVLGFNDTGEYATDTNGDNVPVRIKDRRQRVVFHTLRHTFASWLVMKGTPLYTVAELMGHTTLEMTRRYAHLAPDTLRSAALSLQGQLKKTPSPVLKFQQRKAS
jgi:Site-specific recombinase XerD